MTTLGGFTLVDRIGAGGMGEVWRAERIGPGNVRRRAAVKRILARYQTDPVLRQRFIAEARITSRLEHPNIVQVLDFGDTPELFLVLEYVDGKSLSQLLETARRHGHRLPVPAAMFIVAEAAAGLDHAHRRTDDFGVALGIVHRDVTPSNVLISVEGAVKVGDFGVAKAADNLHRTEAGLALGKLPYMAPEQARGATIDRRVDVFALGVCLWEALTLERLLPRGAPDVIIAALERSEFPAPSSRAPGIPAELDVMCAYGMHGRASVDLDFAADGTLTRYAVLVQGVPPPYDATVRGCLQVSCSRMRIGPQLHPVAFHGISASF